ncbi:MAG TPA: tetratricopeptide repeat protein [Ktedonobacterales bacterium]
MDRQATHTTTHWEVGGMADDGQAPPQAPFPIDDEPRDADDEPMEPDEPAEPPEAPQRSRASGWLRGALARLPSASRPLPADPLESLLAASAPAASAALDPLSRATRAGAIIAALAPGAPSGVFAPEGAPRVARVIGRDADLDRALAALAGGAALCVHSGGVPGVGKTIFAVEMASRAAERHLFAGGAAWISCEAQSGDSGLAEVITRVARGLREERALAALDPETREAELIAGLRSPDRAAILLALDNVEPTLDLAALLDALLGGYATLLLTTRQPIDDARLTSFALPPLAAPDAERLFTERLRLRAAQRPLAEEQPLVAPLTQALGGLPLLIDLTAAMLGVYGAPLEAALAEAQADAARGATASLRARIDRLWLALTPAQCRTLLGLTLIDGATFPRAVALAVARIAIEADTAPTEEEAADGESSPQPARRAQDVTEGWRAAAAQTLDALIGVGAVEAVAAGRLRLHPQTRQRLAPRLEDEPASVQEALGQAMAGWWLAYARDHSGYEGRAGLEAEAAGLMGALTWSHAHGHARLTLDLAESLGEAWRAHGRRDEALRIASWAADAADTEGQPSERLWARYQLAVAQTEAGKLAPARAGFAEALRIARELDDRLAIRDGAHALAALAARLGDAKQARAGFTEALGLARQMQDAVAIRDELHGLAILDTQAGALDAALAEYDEALTLARALGDPSAIALELHGLALVRMRQGAVEVARASFDEALWLARELGDRSAQFDVLSSLGALDAQQGATERAREELQQALALSQQLRDARRAARGLVWLGEVEAASGSAAAAIECFQQAHALYERLGDAEAARVTERLNTLRDAASASG